MKYSTFFLFISISIIIGCGKPSNPETVLGIQLGKPRDPQVDQLLSSGKIKTNGDINYIYYADNLVADIYVYSIDDADGNGIVHKVLLQFYNPNAKYPVDVDDKFIEPLLKDPIVEMYQNKYGEGKVRKAGGNEYYTWDKGDMTIELKINGYAIPPGENLVWYSPVYVVYEYKEDIQKKMRKEANSKDKKI